jgi:hypothetical protein
VRRDFAQLRAAGLKRARFLARVAKVTSRGIVKLEDVFSPIGFTDHAWIRAEHWRGRIPKSGEHIEFLASVEPYWHNSGEQDLGLFECRVIE